MDQKAGFDMIEKKPESIPVTSYCPDFAMIPLSAMISLAQRFELGSQKYARDSWRKNLDTFSDKYLVERLNHVIYHAKKLQAKLEGHIPWDKDDDVGAILWGGAVAAEGIAKFHAGKIDPSIDGDGVLP